MRKYLFIFLTGHLSVCLLEWLVGTLLTHCQSLETTRAKRKNVAIFVHTYTSSLGKMWYKGYQRIILEKKTKSKCPFTDFSQITCMPVANVYFYIPSLSFIWLIRLSTVQSFLFWSRHFYFFWVWIQAYSKIFSFKGIFYRLSWQFYLKNILATTFRWRSGDFYWRKSLLHPAFRCPCLWSRRYFYLQK